VRNILAANRCTVLGSTPNRLAIFLTPSVRPGAFGAAGAAKPLSLFLGLAKPRRNEKKRTSALGPRPQYPYREQLILPFDQESSLPFPSSRGTTPSAWICARRWWLRVVARSRLQKRGALMTTYQPATPHSDSIKRPDCSKCATTMRLFGIEAERPGYELHSFECPKCNHIQTAIGRAP
jgi:hypothetical protein